MTKLRDFLTSERIPQIQFADRLGVRQATISRLCSGEGVPSLELAARIERETGGAVPMNSWVPDATAPAEPTPETPNEDAA
jgi:transcriptional regulator with XRE-family HTH domain